MKTMIAASIVLLALMTSSLRADDTSTTTVTSPVISTSTPQVIVSLVDGLHLLDNAMPATFRDNMQGEWLTGATTAIYKKYYVSADMGWAVPLENNNHGMYILAGRFYLGQLLTEKVSILSALPTHSIVTSSLIKYLTAGFWGARDFNNGVWRAGEYVGFEVKLDYLNWIGKS